MTPPKRRQGRATASLHRPVSLIILFMAPAALVYGTFFVFPMLRAVWLSFFEGTPSSNRFVFVGLENYRTALLRDADFWNALFHNLEILVVTGVATLVLAMTLAFGLTRIGRGKNVFRVLFLFPNVMAAVATAILWSFIFNPSFGILNALLRATGLGNYAHAWLGEPQFALPALMLVQVWSGVGFYIVLFYAGILSIPTDYMDAARIDGASGFQEFRHITLPLLGEIMKIAVIYVIINAMNVFSLVYLITEGNPDRDVDVVLTYLYEQAFTNSNYGYACAIGVILLVFLLTIAGAVSRFLRRETVELS